MRGGQVRSSGDQAECIRATVQERHGRHGPVPWRADCALDFAVYWTLT